MIEDKLQEIEDSNLSNKITHCVPGKARYRNCINKTILLLGFKDKEVKTSKKYQTSLEKRKKSSGLLSFDTNVHH